jgi:hypothetical protein
MIASRQEKVMSDTHAPQRLPQRRPAIGGGGRLSRKLLGREALVVVILAILLLATKHIVAAREVGPDPLAAMPGGKTVVAGMASGGVPNDAALEALSISYKVDGVVNLTGPNVAEQVSASSLHLGYLQMTLATGTAPTLAQLRTLTGFMSSHAVGGNDVYIHDDDGGDSAATTAAMLLVLKGMSWPAVQQALSAAKLSNLYDRQSAAISQLMAALSAQGKPVHGNPYSGAKVVPW